MAMLLKNILFFFVGSAGAFFISRFGHKLRLTDIPSQRSSHSIPTPKGGGIGILSVFIICSLFSGVNNFIWTSVAFLSLVSFLGDFVHISRRLRLFFQIVAACVCIYASDPTIGLISIIVWAVFISGTANLYNFMDGINGIAGITAACAMLLVSVWVGYGEAYITVFIAIGIACLGFLPFNIPNAKVFMGDVGSILIGFWFGFLVFRFSSSFFSFIAMLSFMLPFYVDSVGTILLRLINGENIAKPHRNHLYQILTNEAGIAHWKVSLVYGLFQLLSGVSFIFFTRRIGNVAGIATFFLCLAIFSFMLMMLRKKIRGAFI